ncbi:MAG: phosphoribosylformylglycinamidine synthase subunit PurL [Polyangia bacterium]
MPPAVPEPGQAGERLDDEAGLRVAQRLGLLPREYESIRAQLGRCLGETELAVFAGLWSEHCSYKSTRHLLRTLPRAGARVLAGPGSHAGVVDVGEGWAVAFKIESHNHPSAVEPYQGAATGVGGILRDVIAQGARPCAVMDFLCFGDPASARTRAIARGVVAGISGYGNAIGVPNLGGRTHFDPRYEGNPLVNALAAGLVRPEAQRGAAAPGVGHVFLLVGARTGRDGILGAAFASEALDDSSAHGERRSHIQVGDPFAGKKLLEACLSFSPEMGLLAAQDLGACGLACAAFEMAAASGSGLELELDAVPLREPDLSGHEILLSESQERFAFLVRAAQMDEALAHFRRAGVHAAALGRTVAGGRVRVRHRGALLVDLPAELVSGGAPATDWPLAEALPPRVELECAPASGEELAALLVRILAEPGVRDPAPIYDRYDQTVGNRTVCGPGQAAAAVLRLPGSARGFALTLTGRGDLCAADPYRGTLCALAEAQRRIGSIGAELCAFTDGLNFASPRDPVEHRRIVEVIRALRDGLLALGVPVTGGNVSLYNQSPRGPIPPTPMLGALGLVADVRRVPRAALRPGLELLLWGALRDTPGTSLYARLRTGRLSAGMPAIDLGDLATERRLADALRAALAERPVVAAAVPAHGGLLTALAKLCVRGDTGARIVLPGGERPDWRLLGEHPAQVVWAVEPAEVAPLLDHARRHALPCAHIGRSGGERLSLRVGEVALALDRAQLAAAYRAAPV